MVKPDFVLRMMEELELRYFRIFNSTSTGKLYESMQDITIQQAQKRFKDFFDNAGDGVYWVLALKKPLTPGGSQKNKDAYEYEVVKSSTMQDPPRQTENQPINGMNHFLTPSNGMLGAVDMATHLGSKDIIMELKMLLQSKEYEIKRLEDRIEDLKSQHERELKASKDPHELVKNIAPTILGAMNGLDLSKFMKS